MIDSKMCCRVKSSAGRGWDQRKVGDLLRDYPPYNRDSVKKDSSDNQAE